MIEVELTDSYVIKGYGHKIQLDSAFLTAPRRD